MWSILFFLSMYSFLSYTSEHGRVLSEISVSTQNGNDYLFRLNETEIPFKLDALCKVCNPLKKHREKITHAGDFTDTQIDQNMCRTIAVELNNPPENLSGAWYVINKLAQRQSPKKARTHKLNDNASCLFQAILKTYDLSLKTIRPTLFDEFVQAVSLQPQQILFLDDPMQFLSQFKLDELDITDNSTIKKRILSNYLSNTSNIKKKLYLSEFCSQVTTTVHHALLARHLLEDNRRHSILNLLPSPTHGTWFDELPRSIQNLFGIYLKPNTSILDYVPTEHFIKLSPPIGYAPNQLLYMVKHAIAEGDKKKRQQSTLALASNIRTNGAYHPLYAVPKKQKQSEETG